ncbi:MAG: hypothetical protein ACOWW1_06245 [archaeon]
MTEGVKVYLVIRDFVVFDGDLLCLMGFLMILIIVLQTILTLLEVVVLFSTIIVRLLLKCLKKSCIY